MKIIIAVIILMILFGFFYISLTINQPVSCEFKQVNNGFTQLQNCARYKINEIYLKDG